MNKGYILIFKFLILFLTFNCARVGELMAQIQSPYNLFLEILMVREM
jgi:hypothetical protein